MHEARRRRRPNPGLGFECGRHFGSLASGDRRLMSAVSRRDGRRRPLSSGFVSVAASRRDSDRRSRSAAASGRRAREPSVPREPALEFAFCRDDPANGADLTAATRASGCIGKVTMEISQRSISCDASDAAERDRGVPLTVRKPIERPSMAPARIRDRTSRALATSGIRRPRTRARCASSAIRSQTPIGCVGIVLEQHACTPAGPRSDERSPEGAGTIDDVARRDPRDRIGWHTLENAAGRRCRRGRGAGARLSSGAGLARRGECESPASGR